MRLTRKYRDTPWEIWKLHEEHQYSSSTNARITTALSQKLVSMKVADFPYPTKCLDVFDSKLEKFNEISLDNMPPSMTVSFLKSTTHGNTELLSALASCETICKNIFTNSIPAYNQYFEYLMSNGKKLEDAITNNLTSCKANAAVSDYMQPYSPLDEYFDDDNDLSSFMAHRGTDVNMIQDVLQCNKALKQGKPLPPAKTY